MEGIDQALEHIRAARAETNSRRVIVLAELDAIDKDLRRLSTAERALDPAVVAQRRETSVDAVRAVLAEKHTATQAEIARAIGRPKNTAKAALERLMKDGVVVATGRVVSRSPEFSIAS